MFIAKRRLPRLLIVAVAVALGIFLLWRLPPFAGPTGTFAFDPTRPDALIRSYSLSRLPADLLRMPLARDVLTEDFVAYYQQDEGRLALSGAVRRIAYEHKLDLPEKLVEAVLDEPAEVALWRGGDGRLRDFVVVMTRNTLARAIQTILPVVAKVADAQISSAGKLDGTDVEILALEYGRAHRLLLLARGDRVVALSNPGMLLAPNPGNDAAKPWIQTKATARILRELLDDDSALSPFARQFRLEKTPPGRKHELIVGARVFAFGYETFAPGLAALALAFNDRGEWQSAALFDDQPVGSAGDLWTALPHGPGLCASLPMDWTRAVPILRKFNDRLAQPAVPTWFVDHFAGPAAVCWYKNSRLYTPLFAARLKSSVDKKLAEEFFALADSALGAGKGESSFSTESGIAAWHGSVASRFGSDDDDGQRSLKPALALQGDLVFFSPDAALVDGALDVAAKRYPALTDSFAKTGGETLAFVAPQALAALLHKETIAALPRNEEALFRNAADAYLLPRFEALARYAPQRVKLERQGAARP